MSGFFCTTKEVIKRANHINPIGFKIGLEIMARARCRPIKDVAITFQNRAAGESKLSGKMITLYAEQLCHLYWDKFGYMLVAFLLLVVLILMYVASWCLAVGRQFLR